jgi:hypothetical protein
MKALAVASRETVEKKTSESTEKWTLPRKKAWGIEYSTLQEEGLSVDVHTRLLNSLL